MGKASQQKLKSAIDELVDQQMLKMLKDDPELLYSLPSGAKASLIASRLPKAAPIDQDFEKSKLSLESLLEDLPGEAHSHGVITALRSEVKKLRAEKTELKARLRRANSAIEKAKGRDTARESFRKALVAARQAWIEWGAHQQVLLDQYHINKGELQRLIAVGLGEEPPAEEGEPIPLNGKAAPIE